MHLLTGPWDESVLRAGLSLAPGPLTAAIVAVTSGGLAARVGQGPAAVLGNVVFAAGVAWWLWRVGAEPDYAAAFLPGLLLCGVVLPSLSTAIASTLAPRSLGTGSALLAAARQLGTIPGVAGVVAIYGGAPRARLSRRSATAGPS